MRLPGQTPSALVSFVPVQASHLCIFQQWARLVVSATETLVFNDRRQGSSTTEVSIQPKTPSCRDIYAYPKVYSATSIRQKGSERTHRTAVFRKMESPTSTATQHLPQGYHPSLERRSSAALIEGPSTTIAIKRGPNSLQRERWQQRLMTPDHASRLATIAKCLRQGTYIGRTAGDGMARLQRHDGRISRAQQTVCRTVRSLEAAAEIQLRCRIRSAQPAAVGPNAS